MTSAQEQDAFAKFSLCRAQVEALRGHYRTGQDNLAVDFFEPCLACCTTYRRAVGFFSSSSLVSWSRALPRIVRIREVEINLLISPWLAESDRKLLQELVEPADRLRWLQAHADRIVLDALAYSQDPGNEVLRARLFAWLVASGRLELRFAIPRHLPDPGIYHEKIGIFDFPWGDRVAFTGSANETISGHSQNYESLDVFRSWVPADADRVQVKAAQFDDVWSDQSGTLDVVPLSSDALEKIRSMAPEAPPGFPSPHPPEPEPPNRWEHQDHAVEIFLEKQRGILEMATGTGKTRTTSTIAKKLISDAEIRTVIVATDGTDLLNQWYDELLALTQELPFPFALYRHYATYHERELFNLSPHGAILLTSRYALPPALRRLPEDIGQRTLLVHDEVHGLGSRSNREELEGLSDVIRYRLGLSATPEREYDEAGNEFLTEHVGPVIFEFTLKDAIRKGILAPFNYHPLPYLMDDDDRAGIQQVYARQAAAKARGEPMTDAEVWTALARVHKTSKAKLPIFDDFLKTRTDLLTRCIVFVETVEYGQTVLQIVHRYRHDFHQYFSEEESVILERFAEGELECLLTCHRLSEGIDIKSLRTVVLFSSARSRLETIQRIGRCLRRDPMNPTKRANVVDFIRESESDQANADQNRASWLSELAQVRPEG